MSEPYDMIIQPLLNVPYAYRRLLLHIIFGAGQYPGGLQFPKAEALDAEKGLLVSPL